MLDNNFIDNYKQSHIVITNDFNTEKDLLKNKQDSNIDFIIKEYQQTFKIDDARDIINLAYISGKRRVYAIFAPSYNVLAQNAMLKVLEDPIKNVSFIIYITSKNKLIPTIFSRLPRFDKRQKDSIKPFALDITRLSVPVVYEYISSLEKNYISSEEGRILLHSLLDSIARNNILLSQKQLERFDLALKSLNTGQAVHFVLLPILLSLIKG